MLQRWEQIYRQNVQKNTNRDKRESFPLLAPVIYWSMPYFQRFCCVYCCWGRMPAVELPEVARKLHRRCSPVADREVGRRTVLDMTGHTGLAAHNLCYTLHL